MEEERKSNGKSRMKRIARFVFACSFLVGFAILIYPYVADQWNTWRQHKLITTYQQAVQTAEEADLSEQWEAALAYNEEHGPSDVYADVFDGDTEEYADSDYWQVLNLNGDGMMGYLSIPKINITLPIYHGTSSDVLREGVGHISGSQLPIGGEGNHAVLAAHRGLSTAKLFTDLNKLAEGDQFYLYILDEVLAYEVDQILTIDKDDEVALSEAMATVEGEDYVTLFTCTPYGVNSHRLLVRGHRIDYVEEETEQTVTAKVVQSVRTYYIFYLLAGLIVTACGVLIVRLRARRHSGELDEHEEKEENE